jgi:cysteine-rich repeat protein
VVTAGEACDDGNRATGDGCTADCRREAEAASADAVLEAPGASGSGFGDPSRATNGVRGGGPTQQSLDVYSIPAGEHLVLGWEGRRVVDGPGLDLVVFENAFRYGDGLTFMDPTVVEVSADGERWVAFPHDYVAEDETTYSPREEHWVGFAGVRPVLLHVDEAAVDPFDPQAAGGDAFDLADLPDPELRARGIRFVRLSAAAAHENPDTGAPFVADPVSNGPDIDGVMARYLAEAP